MVAREVDCEGRFRLEMLGGPVVYRHLDTTTGEDARGHGPVDTVRLVCVLQVDAVVVAGVQATLEHEVLGCLVQPVGEAHDERAVNIVDRRESRLKEGLHLVERLTTWRLAAARSAARLQRLVRRQRIHDKSRCRMFRTSRAMRASSRSKSIAVRISLPGCTRFRYSRTG